MNQMIVNCSGKGKLGFVMINLVIELQYDLEKMLNSSAVFMASPVFISNRPYAYKLTSLSFTCIVNIPN